MLDCRLDRLDYGKSLCPPDGYHFDAAVATTYSANLSTILSIPVALVYAETLEGDLSSARLQLLEAIKVFSHKVKIYHQEGQLHVPSQLNWLYAHLESCLHGILMEDVYSAFHPKTWLIRYTPNDGSDATLPVKYRLLVLSRNLTFDRNWDIAASFEGEVDTSRYERNQPLIDFHRWLNEKEPFPSADIILAELPHVDFELPNSFDTCYFHPIGIDGYRQNPTVNQTCDNTLIISPFLHQDYLASSKQHTTNQVYLFSQHFEMKKMPLALVQSMNCFQLNPLIIEGEYIDLTEEGDSHDQQYQNLHAKFYCLETPALTRCLLGSANATVSATGKNIEFLVELQTAERKQPLIDQVLLQLVGDDDRMGAFDKVEFTEADAFDPDEYQRELQIRSFEHALLTAKRSGHITRRENNQNYDVHIQIDLSTPTLAAFDAVKFSASLKPFNIKGGTPVQSLAIGEDNTYIFQNISEVELSQFFEFTIESSATDDRHRFLLKTPLAGMPENRFDNLLAKLIDSSQKFFEYLQFLISEDISKEDLLAMGEIDSLPESNTCDTIHPYRYSQLPLFEQLLVAVSRDPRRLIAVDEVIKGLQESSEKADIIPTEFLDFWQTFRPFIPKPSA